MSEMNGMIEEVEMVCEVKKIPIKRYAGVKFNGKPSHYNNETEYTFFTDLENLNVGDYVVCDCSTGYAVGQVMRIMDVDTVGKSNRWLIQKVDMESHIARLAKDARRKEIRIRMDARRKQLEDEQLYRMMAERDPEMAMLIKEYYDEDTQPKIQQQPRSTSVEVDHMGYPKDPMVEYQQRREERIK